MAAITDHPKCHLNRCGPPAAPRPVALLVRRRHPIGALVGVLVVYAVFQLPPTMLLPVLVALFTVATHRP